MAHLKTALPNKDKKKRISAREATALNYFTEGWDKLKKLYPGLEEVRVGQDKDGMTTVFTKTRKE